ncbi:hypothetical protein DTO271D3_5370 [Paecilomyces variotii]|nr:hypothetical protein DTO169E5_911 [Paecilomyces variotii]KAJ9314393.1 hypothetical protein DTO271D3_5370 [Paecilomyces variotii]
MSWDGYLNDHVVGSLIDKAVVIDVTGAAVWAKSNGAQISPDEMKTFASAFSDKSKAEESGVSFGGSKYFFTKLEDLTHESLPERTIPTLHVAKGKEGVVAAKCTQGILIAHYPEGVFFGDAIDAVVKNASHLVKNGNNWIFHGDGHEPNDIQGLLYIFLPLEASHKHPQHSIKTASIRSLA